MRVATSAGRERRTSASGSDNAERSCPAPTAPAARRARLYTFTFTFIRHLGKTHNHCELDSTVYLLFTRHEIHRPLTLRRHSPPYNL